MTERQWLVDIESGQLISDDGFYYIITKTTNDKKPVVSCKGHPMLAASELGLIREIAAEAYSAYTQHLKGLH